MSLESPSWNFQLCEISKPPEKGQRTVLLGHDELCLHIFYSVRLPKRLWVFCRPHYTSYGTVSSLKGLADGYPKVASTGTSHCSHLHSILMRPSWNFSTALKRLSKKTFPSDMSHSPSAEHAVCSYSRANTPWRPDAYPHAHSVGNAIFLSSQYPRTL